MTDAPRYPVTPQHPPMHVRVIVQWDGRVFAAARVLHPREKRYCWVRRYSDGGEKYLPPRINAKAENPAAHAWSPEPEWWRPEKPKAWQTPLPAPLPPIVVPEWRRIEDHGHVEFEGDLENGRVARAGLMINIRARRRRAERFDERSPADKLPWWFPGSTAEGAEEIVYEPDTVDAKGRPAISRKMAEGRVMRAAAVSGATGLQGQPKKKQDRTFQDVAEAAEEIEKDIRRAQESASRRVEFEPGPDDIRDWDTAMAWFAALNPPDLRDDDHEPFMLNLEQSVLVWRARLWSWRSVADYIGRSIRYTRDIYNTAIDRVHRVANGREPYPQRKARDHLSELRERNRAFHNRENPYD